MRPRQCLATRFRSIWDGGIGGDGTIDFNRSQRRVVSVRRRRTCLRFERGLNFASTSVSPSDNNSVSQATITNLIHLTSQTLPPQRTGAARFPGPQKETMPAQIDKSQLGWFRALRRRINLPGTGWS